MLRFSFKTFILAGLVTCAGGNAAQAATWYVSPCGQDFWAGVNVNCIAPLGPKRTIQAAINAAANGDTVLVMPGTYLETIDLDGKAITLTGAAGPNTTTIDGNGDGPVVLCNSLEGPNTIIQGFTIRNGYVDGDGGGLLIALASPTVNNCIIRDNVATDWGGGMYSINASPTISNCMFFNNEGFLGGGAFTRFGQPQFISCDFTGNEASLWGGGLLLDHCAGASLSDCDFSTNDAPVGGGVMGNYGEAAFENCDFADNLAGASGGGAYLVSMDQASFDGCEFIANDVAPDLNGDTVGGAMTIVDCAATLNQCSFTTNTAIDGGGAIMGKNADGSTFSACTFTNNVNFGNGGSAIHFDATTASLVGCTFTNNNAQQFGGALHVVELSNITATLCGFHDNRALGPFGAGAAIVVSYSSVTAGLCTLIGNQAGAGGGAVYSVNSHPTTLNGCVFTNNSAVNANSMGGAVRAWHSDLTMSGCTLSNNNAPRGGAVFAGESCEATLANCTFNDNSATGHGGALFAEPESLAILVSDFQNNSSGAAGGAMFVQGPAAVCTLDNVEFTANSAATGGGALTTGSETTVISCGFAGNSAHDAAGLAVMGPFGVARVVGSRFDANNATQAGSAAMVGAFSPGGELHMLNCIVSKNTCGFGGGALHETALGGFMHIANCAIVDNSGGGLIINNGASTSVLANSIVWGNTSGQGVGGNLPDVHYCNIQGGVIGSNSISANPMFVNAATGNYHLLSGSPCVDAGINAMVPMDALDLDGDGNTDEYTPVDFDGVSRFANDPATADSGCGGLTVVDMGPYELGGVALPELRPADVNADGVVNAADLIAVILAWGPCPSDCCPEDINHDGEINVIDLLAVIADWG